MLSVLSGNLDEREQLARNVFSDCQVVEGLSVLLDALPQKVHRIQIWVFWCTFMVKTMHKVQWLTAEIGALQSRGSGVLNVPRRHRKISRGN